MKEFLFTILILMAVWPAIGQISPGAPTNIAVGEFTVLAAYPEMAEFVLNIQASQVTIVRFDSAGNDHQSTYQAILTQTEPDMYRAEFCGDSWVEVNVATGSTTLCHKGRLEAFFPPGIVQK
jgi:hypothetical protein